VVKPENWPRRRSAVMPQWHKKRQSQLLHGEALGDLTMARESVRNQASLVHFSWTYNARQDSSRALSSRVSCPVVEAEESS